ncbi:hypothetical protein [Pelagibacterium montanilacus]|uniref:hypothetical protein n=1 Tax=Pelagibacterium montanilacus TaxID=2185280 RepID=UPI000F8C5BEB|nr:hypothetical protein [Pelagibacterium montanilacus]
MSSDPIDLDRERNRRASPDPEHVRYDDFGRPLYEFTCSYSRDGKRWGTTVWAYSMADAESRARAMRSNLTVEGQLFSTIPL